MDEESARRLGVDLPPEAPWPNRALHQLARCERVLMLQGPVGPFFHDLARVLRGRGITVDKINFNGGDQRFFPGGYWFRGAPDQFADLLAERVRRDRPQACVLFGQDRPVHTVARQVLGELGVPVMVFEEGYVRPNFVTFEVGGVNSRSSFRWAPDAPSDVPALLPRAPQFQLPFRCVASLAAQYHLLNKLASPLYPAYPHHRPTGVLVEAWAWARAGLIKTWAPLHARRVTRRLTDAPAPHYFLVPLQVHNDSQLHHHSGYATVVTFIDDVLRSFARHAPADAHLVFKHHPMNRGHRNYRGLLQARIAQLNAESGTGTGTETGTKEGADGRGESLKHRVHYLLDGHLPTLLEHARGTVLINSTVGLSSMFHGTPVMPLGQALYHRPGLTFQGELDDFWRAPGEVDAVLFSRFLADLIAQTQLPGSFYWPQRRYAGLLTAIETALGTVPRVARPATAIPVSAMQTVPLVEDELAGALGDVLGEVSTQSVVRLLLPLLMFPGLM